MNIRSIDSHRRKRCPPVSAHDDLLVTPKRLRIQSYLPPSPASRSVSSEGRRKSLSIPLNRLLSLHTTLQHALSHALATAASSPSRDEGIIPNVLNQTVLKKHGFDIRDLLHLCWFWEWDSSSDVLVAAARQEDDDPFVADSTSRSAWQRGSMGMIITASSHFDRNISKRVPVYGIGIEVEMDLNKGYVDGVAAVARWAAGATSRTEELVNKLLLWMELQKHEDPVPPLPLARLPTLRKDPDPIKNMQRPLPDRLPSPAKPFRQTTRSVSHQMLSFPPISPAHSAPSTPADYKRPLYLLPTPQSTLLSTPKKAVIPRTLTPLSLKSDPRTPTSSKLMTPSSDRRSALYERVRQRSLSRIAHGTDSPGGPLSAEQFQTLATALMRRRCLLGRLASVAEGIWMLFSGPATSMQERRAMRFSAVVNSVVKSSSVPISDEDAGESVDLLVELCPEFLRKFAVGHEDWIEMPFSGHHSNNGPSFDEPKLLQGNPSKIHVVGSPRKCEVEATEDNLLRRSPKSLKCSSTGLEYVRERIRRELESND